MATISLGQGRSLRYGAARGILADDMGWGAGELTRCPFGEGGASVVGGTPRRARLRASTGLITCARCLAPRHFKGVPGPNFHF
jgi:hypothetical protein